MLVAVAAFLSLRRLRREEIEVVGATVMNPDMAEISAESTIHFSIRDTIDKYIPYSNLNSK